MALLLQSARQASSKDVVPFRADVRGYFVEPRGIEQARVERCQDNTIWYVRGALAAVLVSGAVLSGSAATPART
jgi:hypothetical protein